MFNSKILTALTFFMCLMPAAASHAFVNLVSTESTGFRSNVDDNVTKVEVSSGSGAAGDYEILICSTITDGGNEFLEPTPDGWTTIHTGTCGGSGNCIFGIFARFDESPDSSVVTCNWTVPTGAVTAMTLRYSGVSIENPVLDVECSAGLGSDQLVIPSVDTEPGSSVVLTYSFGFLGNNIKNLNATPIQQGGTVAVGQSTISPVQQVISAAQSSLYRTGGPTGEFRLGLAGEDWTGCAVSLSPGPTSIPTLSEWGLGIFAALFGIAAVWTLRRRTVGAWKYNGK